MNFAAFIESISVNSVTSIINFKHWLTLLRVNCKQWPWSLILDSYENVLSLYIILWGRLNAFRLTAFFSFLEWNALNCVYPGDIMLHKIHMENAVNSVLKLRFIAAGPSSRNSYNFNVVRCTTSAEILWICQATSSVVQFIKKSKAFLHRLLWRGANPLGVEKLFKWLKVMYFHSKNKIQSNLCKMTTLGSTQKWSS